MYNTDIYIKLDNKTYCFNNVESAFQAHKNPAFAHKFVGLSGYDARALGRRVPLRSDWDEIKDNIMEECVDAKFDSNLYLRKQLGEIDGHIEEANSWGDRYWGTVNGVGENRLGKILMRKRDEIQLEKNTPYVRNTGNSRVIFPDSFVVVDLETTGFDPRHDRIIELSAMRIRNNNITLTFSTFVNPMRPIPREVSDLTGITNKDVESYPEIQDVLPQFLSFAGSDIIVGYGVGFDVNFIYDNERRLTGNDFKNDYIDVMQIAQKHLGKKKKLTDLASSYGANTGGAHRALNDCVMCLNCFQALQRDIKSKMSLDDFSSMYDPLLQPKQLNLFGPNNVNTNTGTKPVLTVKNNRVQIVNAGNSSFNGKNFKSSFGEHKFTDDELCRLAEGEEIEIKGFKTKVGNTIDIKGKLGIGVLPNGKTYFGFQRTDVNTRRVPSIEQDSNELGSQQPSVKS